MGEVLQFLSCGGLGWVQYRARFLEDDRGWWRECSSEMFEE